MADDIDRANDYIESWLEERIRERGVAEIPKGKPGECDWCGIYNKRLINGYCARCRDEKAKYRR